MSETPEIAFAISIDVFGHFNALNGGFQTAKSNSRDFLA